MLYIRKPNKLISSSQCILVELRFSLSLGPWEKRLGRVAYSSLGVHFSSTWHSQQDTGTWGDLGKSNGVPDVRRRPADEVDLCDWGGIIC